MKKYLLPEKFIYLWWLIPISLIGFNFWLSGLSWEEIREGLSWVRNIPQSTNFKLRHILQYGPLAALTAHACRRTTRLSLNQCLIVGLIVSSLSGAFEELHQSFIPGRIAAVKDIGFNVVGAAVGVVLYYFFSNWHLKRSSRANKGVQL